MLCIHSSLLCRQPITAVHQHSMTLQGRSETPWYLYFRHLEQWWTYRETVTGMKCWAQMTVVTLCLYLHIFIPTPFLPFPDIFSTKHFISSLWCNYDLPLSLLIPFSSILSPHNYSSPTLMSSWIQFEINCTVWGQPPQHLSAL